MIFAQYITILLIGLTAVSALDLDYVKIDETSLIQASKDNYAIVFQENGFIWKIVMFNNNHFIIRDGLCDDYNKGNRGIPEADKASYHQIQNSLQTFSDDEFGQGKPFEDKYFLRAKIHGNGQKQVLSEINNFEQTSFLGKNVAIPLSLPFADSSQSGLMLVTDKFVSIVDFNGRINVQPTGCLTQAQSDAIRELIGESRMAMPRSESTNSDYLYQQEEGAEIQPGSPASRLSLSRSESVDPYDMAFIFGQLPEGESPASLDDIVWKMKVRVTNKMGTLFSPEHSDSKELKDQLNAMIEASNITEEKCKSEYLRQWAKWHNDPELMKEGTNMRHFLIQSAKKQMQLCLETLEKTVAMHGRQIAVPTREYLFNFMHQVTDQINEDESNASERFLSIDENIPIRSLYKALVKFLKCREADLARLVKKASKTEVKYVLADAIESHLGKSCYIISNAVSEDLKFLELLVGSKLDVFDDIKLREEINDILNIARTCRLIDQQVLDKDRLLSVYSSESHNKMFSCLLPGR